MKKAGDAIQHPVIEGIHMVNVVADNPLRRTTMLHSLINRIKLSSRRVLIIPRANTIQSSSDGSMRTLLAVTLGHTFTIAAT